MAYMNQRAQLTHLDIEQGVEMGRPSHMHCEMHGDRALVGGNVVVLPEGTVSL